MQAIAQLPKISSLAFHKRVLLFARREGSGSKNGLLDGTD
jgi:hypothetical protein